jgi:two-component system, LytTR family, response regulator
MAEIRALIVDDEPLARRGVRQLLEEHQDVTVVGECRDGREAVRAMATLKPDLVFLDIQMPGLDGLGVIRLFGVERMPLTVFVTAFDAFAVKAFESQALDYLVKPLSAPRFHATMARVRERLRLRDAVGMARHLAALLAGASAEGPGSGEEHLTRGRRSAAGARNRLAVPMAGGVRMLNVDAIDWIEVDGDGSRVWTGGRGFHVAESVSALERVLDPARFVRAHRGALVRLGAVRELRSEVTRRDAALVLADGTLVPVSRRRVPSVRSALLARRLPG